ncbi:MAG: hypothetical protein IPK72_15785 [Candidatus Eisenbacteria bacterium]|nr:hypothetical protein [Candidatus Eisenbacteria bacterium]
MKPEGLRRLTDAIRRDREVEVDADGHVREVPKSPALPEPVPAKSKPTKLAPRTFGVVSSATELLHVIGLESAL